MCEYCEEDEKILIKNYEICRSSWGWGCIDQKINLKEAEEGREKYGIFIDRGYLRYALLEDCGCLDHGKKIKINFCPMRGEKTSE